MAKVVCEVGGVAEGTNDMGIERGALPVLRSANIREGGIQLTDLVFISAESNEQLSKSMLHTDDVVTVRTGYPGTTCVVPSHLDGANCVDDWRTGETQSFEIRPDDRPAHRPRPRAEQPCFQPK